MAFKDNGTVKTLVTVLATLTFAGSIGAAVLLFQTNADAAIQDTDRRNAWAAIHANAVAIGVLDERSKTDEHKDHE